MDEFKNVPKWAVSVLYFPPSFFYRKGQIRESYLLCFINPTMNLKVSPYAKYFLSSSLPLFLGRRVKNR